MNGTGAAAPFSLRRNLTFSLVGPLTLALAAALSLDSGGVSHPWVADNGDGTYKNPVLFADYSDPDVIRVGTDFYLTASSFDSVPGLPILHSKDLVNWSLIGHALPRQPPLDVYSKPQHGNGAWAPAIRYHGGEFFIYYPDPDYGIYVLKARNPAGPWSAPLLIKDAKGWIDPCPLWDDDGSAYLVNAMAGSRSGIKSVVIASKMSADGTKLLDEGSVVYDGHGLDPTIEGPKLYKRNGYYYISAPAGGVPNGWHVVLRSKNVYGPYERRVTLAERDTGINGPHQGAWVDTPTGEYWFLHFQDRGAYGRVLWLEPMHWVNDWPVMGVDADANGTGKPVLRYRKPNVGHSYPIATPPDSDEFNQNAIGLQWQWVANPQPGWAFPSKALGLLRLFCVTPAAGFKNLWDSTNLLLQKLPAPEFTATTKMTFTPRAEQDKAGLVIMGADYAYIAMEKRGNDIVLVYATCKAADRGSSEVTQTLPLNNSAVYLRVKVSARALCRFSFSTDGASYTNVGEPFTARPGRWIGAKVGLFAMGASHSNEMGNADFDWFRVEP